MQTTSIQPHRQSLTSTVYCQSATNRGGDLGGIGGIVPLKKLGGGDGSAFIPPIFRKCLADLQCKNE